MSKKLIFVIAFLLLAALLCACTPKPGIKEQQKEEQLGEVSAYSTDSGGAETSASGGDTDGNAADTTGDTADSTEPSDGNGSGGGIHLPRVDF